MYPIVSPLTAVLHYFKGQTLSKETAHKISYTGVERAADDSGRNTFKVKLTKSMVFKFLDDDRDGGGEAPAKRAKKNVTGKSVFRYSLDALAKSEFIQSVFRYRFKKIGQTLKLMKPYVVLCQNISWMQKSHWRPFVG